MNTEQKSPGRVSLEGAVSPSIPGFAYPTKAPSNSKQEGIRGKFEKTPLNQAFFSSENFQIIQNKIRKSVYDKSGEIIDPVSTDDLFMVMRATFLQSSRNLPTDIPAQIAELNERVSVWCVPKIVAEVSMYRTYAKDISSLPVPLSHPVNQSGAGTKSLPFKEFF